MPLLTSHEARAHLDILSALDDYSNWLIGRRSLQLRVMRATEAFAPRCPACASVLRRKPAHRFTVFSCACGHEHKEIG